MCLNNKFIHIEELLKNKLKAAEKEFGHGYDSAIREASAEKILCSGNTLKGIESIAVNCYRNYSNESIELILDLFNGKDYKLYTHFGVKKLEKFFINFKVKLQKYLEEEFKNKLNSNLFYDANQTAKDQVQENMISEIENINTQTNLIIYPKLLGIKKISWDYSFLFKQATTIIVSAITSLITVIITNFIKY